MINKSDISSKQLFAMGFPEAVLTLQNVTCQRGGRVVFQNMSITVKSGEVLQVTGSNGAGKSSLLRLIAGGLKPVEGAVLWNEEPLDDDNHPEHAARLGFLPADDRALKVLETVEENMQFWAGIHGLGHDYIYSALDMMGLSGLAATPVRQLSAGQKRRLSLSQIIMRQCPVWLLDEPLNGLDTASTALFNTALSQHVAAGGLAVIASHQPVAGARIYGVGA